MSYKRKEFKDGDVLYASDMNIIDAQLEKVSIDVENLTNDELALENGLGENCIQQTGSIAGCKGYYIKSIDLVNHKIYLTNIQIIPEISETDYTDTNFATPDYTIGAGFTIVNSYTYEATKLARKLHSSGQYILNGAITADRSTVGLDNTPIATGGSICNAEIVNINHNMIEYNGDIGFTEIVQVNPLSKLDYSFYVPANPDVGEVELRGGSIATGNNTMAVGEGSVASGNNTQATGDYSRAEGFWTTAANQGAVAEGNKTFSVGMHSHAEGTHSWALGDFSHAQGAYNTAVGESSHAEGHWAVAKGKYSHAEGSTTVAEGTYSHAEGLYTEAIGIASHAEGWKTKAFGGESHAEGRLTEALGDYSHTEGLRTIATSEVQHVQGKYNVNDPSKIHIIGYGTLDERKNIHTVDFEGNAWYCGDVKVGQTEAEAKTLATVEYVDEVNENLQSDINKVNEDVQLVIDTLLETKTISSWKEVQEIVRTGLAHRVFKIGDKFSCTHEYFGMLDWEIIGFNHDEPVDSQYTHSMTLQLKNCFTDKLEFDAREPGNTVSHFASYGSNIWRDSNIRQWLNTFDMEDAWWTALTNYDKAPSYSEMAGFMYGLDSDFLSVVKPVYKYTKLNDFDNNEICRTEDTFFLLSATELYYGANQGVEEGKPYEYYEKLSTLTAPGGGADENRIKYSNGVATAWYQRSLYKNGSEYNVRCVSTNGGGLQRTASNKFGIAPACVIY
jgi:hypothetical protein